MVTVMFKYQKIAHEIEYEIQTNNTPQGTKLPSINQLAQKYAVSKNTILKTLTVLESNGVIYQVHGSGIFVRQQKRKGYITLLQNKGFSNDLNYPGVTSKLISFAKIKAPLVVATNLQCDTTDDVYKVERLHSIMDQVICLEESYFKASVVTFLNEAIAKDSIFQYLNKGLNINIGFTDKYMSISKTNDDISNYLEVPKNSPMLSMEEIYYTNNGEPFDFTKNYYHYEHAQFFLQS